MSEIGRVVIARSTSDEAIQIPKRRLNCFAPLAMTRFGHPTIVI
jgi:hypothetical protein